MRVVEINNLREGRFRHHAVLVVPCVLGALSLAGLTLHPDLSAHAAREELAQAETRVQDRRVCVEHLAELRDGGGLARVEAVLSGARAMLPPPLPALELHALLRLIAKRCGVALSALEIMEAHDPGLERLDDVVGLREVRVEGASSLRALLSALRALCALDRPVAVLEFHLARSEEPDQYHWTIMLGLFESLPATTFDASQAESSEETER